MKREGWDTRKGRKWVVVAFWGEETTVEFCENEKEAIARYEKGVGGGADVFYAETSMITIQANPNDAESARRDRGLPARDGTTRRRR